jgi:hypothetical protein
VGRTRETLADGNDEVVLVMSQQHSTVARLGWELSPGAGEGVLVSTGDDMRVRLATTLRCSALTLSRRTLASLVAGLEDAFMRPVPRDTEALQLLMRDVRVLDDQQSLSTPRLRHLVVAITSMISWPSRSVRRAMSPRLPTAAAHALRICMRSRRKSSTT